MIQTSRQQIWSRYCNGLADWAHSNGIGIPVASVESEQAYHLFYLLLPSLQLRQAFIQYLKEQNIWTTFHYLPLHLSPMGQQFGGKLGDCPVTESFSDRLVRLPFYNGMTESDQMQVIDAIRSFPMKTD